MCACVCLSVCICVLLYIARVCCELCFYCDTFCTYLSPFFSPPNSLTPFSTNCRWERWLTLPLCCTTMSTHARFVAVCASASVGLGRCALARASPRKAPSARALSVGCWTRVLPVEAVHGVARGTKQHWPPAWCGWKTVWCVERVAGHAIRAVWESMAVVRAQTKAELVCVGRGILLLLLYFLFIHCNLHFLVSSSICL